jgi:predicted NUDIX family phosphoesterase
MRVDMGKMCFVVERANLEGTGFLAPQGECKLTLLTGENMTNLKNILLSGTFRDREGKQNVENDPAFKQVIPYMFAFDSHGRALMYQRNTDLSCYDEKRLSGKVSLGIGGHMIERSIEQGLFREFREEAQLLVNGQRIEFSDDNNGLLKFNSLLNPRLTAVIDDRRDPVGEVHLGIVVATYLRPELKVTMRSGEKGESTNFEYMTPRDYASRRNEGNISPEGWTDIVMERILMQFAILNS